MVVIGIYPILPEDVVVIPFVGEALGRIAFETRRIAVNHRPITANHVLAFDHDRPIAEPFARLIVPITEPAGYRDRGVPLRQSVWLAVTVPGLDDFVDRIEEVCLRHHAVSPPG